MHFEGDFTVPSVTGAEIGAFVDGPELSGSATLPSLGTASYSGPAAGLYAQRVWFGRLGFRRRAG